MAQVLLVLALLTNLPQALDYAVISPKPGMFADIRDREYNNVVNNLIDVVQTMPTRDFSYQPAPGMRTFGQVLGHIVDVSFGLCSNPAGVPAPQRGFEMESDAAVLLDGFWKSIEVCDHAFDAMTELKAAELVVGRTGAKSPRSAPLVSMLVHTGRESGKLVTYLRLKGLTPPDVGLMRGRQNRPRRRTGP